MTSVVCTYLTTMIESDSMIEHPYKEIDELFIQIRHHLAKMAQSDSGSAEEIYRLVRQLEDWIDPLVIDSIKLRTLEQKLKDMFELVRRFEITTDKKSTAL